MFTMLKVALFAGAGAGVALASFHIYKKYQRSSDIADNAVDEAVPEDTRAEDVAEPEDKESISEANVEEVDEVISEVTKVAPADNVGESKVTEITSELPVNEDVPEISVPVPTSTETVSEAARTEVRPEVNEVVLKVTDVVSADNVAVLDVTETISKTSENATAEALPEVKDGVADVANDSEPTVPVDPTATPLKKKKKESACTQRARARRTERRRLERLAKENQLAQEHLDPVDPEFPFLGPIKFQFLQPSQLEENQLAQEHLDPVDPEFPFLGPIKFQFLQPSQLD